MEYLVIVSLANAQEFGAAVHGKGADAVSNTRMRNVAGGRCQRATEHRDELAAPCKSGL